MAEGTIYHLPDKALLEALKSWEIHGVASLNPLSGGFSADVWRLDLADGGTLVAKFAYDTKEVLETQLRTTEFLEARGLAVPRPIRSISGELCVMVEGPPGKHHPLGVMTFIPGNQVEEFDGETQVIAGLLLANIHREMLQADFLSRESKWFYSYLEDESTPIAHENLVRPATREALAAVRAFEAEHELTRGFIIADDLQLMFDSQTGSYGVVDLGHSIFGPLAADVAITQSQIEGRDFASEAFVDTYFAHSVMSDEDRLALPVYLRMRQASILRFFAWRVLHESNYDLAGREANERRFWAVLKKLESNK